MPCIIKDVPIFHNDDDDDVVGEDRETSGTDHLSLVGLNSLFNSFANIKDATVAILTYGT